MKRLKELRESQGLTQQQIAQHINKTFQAYSLYENGKREPDNATLIQLAQYFKVSIDYLLGATDNPQSNQQSEEISPEDLELLRKIKNLPPDKQKAVEILAGPDEQAATGN